MKTLLFFTYYLFIGIHSIFTKLSFNRDNDIKVVQPSVSYKNTLN